MIKHLKYALQVDLYVCRDLDSRFSAREQSAVSEWLDSGQPIHAMRDHPAHNTPLLGAAWGARLSQNNFRSYLNKQNILLHTVSFIIPCRFAVYT